MATLDDLLAAQAAGPTVPPGTLDSMLAARAAGGTIALPATAPAASGIPGLSGGMGQVGDFLSALGHHAMNLPHGLAQLAENAGSGVVNAVAPSSRFAGALTDTVDADNAAMAKREADYQKSTPNSLGAYAGAATGEVAPFLISGPAKLLQSAGNYVADKVLPATIAGRAVPSIVPKAVSAATQGGIVGAAQPVTDAAPTPTLSTLVTGQANAPSYWQQKANQIESSAGVGGALPLVGGIVRGGVNAAAPILNPKSVVSPLVRRLVGDDPAALAALQNPQQLVPGSMPTTAQILATPQAVMTEKAAGNTPLVKGALVTQQAANNEARIAALKNIAGTPQALSDALAARSEAAQPWTNPTTGQLVSGTAVDATPIVNQIKALQTSSLGTDPTVSKAADDLLASIQKGATITGQGENLVRPDLLDGYRQNVRGFLQQNSSNGAVGTRQEAAFEPVRSAIVDSIESANPGYRDYLATYAKNSQPINTMEAAGSLLDNVAGAGRSLNATGDPAVALRSYSTALAKALNTPHGIDPEAQKTLEAIQSDLQRESISNSIKSPGSDTAYNLQAPGMLASALYGNSFSGNTAAARGMGATLGALGGWVVDHYGGAMGGAAAGNYVGGKIANMGQSRVNEVLAKALSDPQFAAQLAQQAKGPNQSLARIPQIAALLGQ